jgi:hypothetical protein
MINAYSILIGKSRDDIRHGRPVRNVINRYDSVQKYSILIYI